MMIVILLKGLPSAYETFRQTLMLQDLSFNQAVEHLKTAESTLPTFNEFAVLKYKLQQLNYVPGSFVKEGVVSQQIKRPEKGPST
jgi:hypothetical protein